MLNSIYTGDCIEVMRGMPSDSVHLVVTSPPYNVGIDYGEDYDDSKSMHEYKLFITAVACQMKRMLVDGGRAVINVAGTARNPYRSLQSYWTRHMEKVGFMMRGDIIWNKGQIARGSTAWGSYASASNPVLRDMHEYILVFSNGSMGRKEEGESTMSGEEFLRWTESIWKVQPESAKQVGHPAPFPIAIPHRLINLYSYKGDIVMDPFCGSGTTCVAARNCGRQYVGIERNPKFVKLAEKRLSQQHLW